LINLHGWAQIRESYRADSEELHINEIKEKIFEQIKKFKWRNHTGIISLDFLNGNLHLTYTVSANRARNETREIFELLEFICFIASGSFGLTYFHDDEDMNGMDNYYHVYILAKGTITESVDKFLSPLIPTIEDNSHK